MYMVNSLLETIHHFGSGFACAPTAAYLVLIDEEKHDGQDLQEEDEEQQEEELRNQERENTEREWGSGEGRSS